MRRTNVQKMYSNSVDFGLELRKSCEPVFSMTPVVLVKPIRTNFLRISERQTLRPIIDALALRPSRSAQAAFQIVEFGVGRRDFEGCDFVAHRSLRLRDDFRVESDMSPTDPLMSS